MESYVATFEVGGTFVKAAVFSSVSGEAVAADKAYTPATSAEICGLIAASYRSFLNRVRGLGGRIAGVGLSLPSAVDPVSGSLAACGNIPDLHTFRWREETEAAFGMTPLILNDAKAALVGECSFGSAIGQTDVCLVVVGTGIGSALMIDGRVVHGRAGGAGEIGYMPLLGQADGIGRSGMSTLHDVLAAPALVAEVERWLGPAQLPAGPQCLRELLSGGSDFGPTKTKLLGLIGETLAGTLKVLDSVVASDLYVLAGGVGCNDLVVDQVRCLLAKDRRCEVHVTKAALGDRAGLSGLYASIRERQER